MGFEFLIDDKGFEFDGVGLVGLFDRLIRRGGHVGFEKRTIQDRSHEDTVRRDGIDN